MPSLSFHDLLNVVKLTLIGAGWLGLFAVAIYGYGALAIHFLRASVTQLAETSLICFALGWGVLAHLTFLVGSLGQFRPMTAWSLIGIGWISGGIFAVRAYRDHRWDGLAVFLRRSTALFQVKKAGLRYILLAVLSVIIIGNLAFSFYTNALTPPTSNDEVAYHLAIPKIYTQNQRISYISFIPYSNWPLETEMLFTLSLLVQGDLPAHLLTWSAGVVICLSLIGFGKRYFNTEAGCFAAAIFSSTPVFRYLAGSGLIEVPLTLFFLGCLVGFFVWLETRKTRDLVLSAIFGGLAASTKLNGAVLPLIAASAIFGVILISNRRDFGKALRGFLTYGIVSFLVVAPWYIKSWVLTGNPLWPFLAGVFGARGWDSLGTEYLMGFIQLPNLPISLANWFTAAWKLTFPDGQFGPSIFRIGTTYLLCLPIVLFGVIFSNHPKKKWLIWCGAGSFILYSSWFLQTQQSRFLLPALPLFALAIAGAATLLIDRFSHPAKILAWIGISGLLFSSFWMLNRDDRRVVYTVWPFLSGQEDRAAYLSRVIPGYAVYDYANHNLPSGSLIWLALYESRGYYLDQNYAWANPISQRIFPLEGFTSSGDLAEALKKAGFRYVIFRDTGLEKYTYIRYGGQITALVRDAIATQTHLLYRSSELSLYELTP
jgi:4-amino-4-deoxy-L-arabinose transferase-like glycosyltransferase